MDSGPDHGPLGQVIDQDGNIAEDGGFQNHDAGSPMQNSPDQSDLKRSPDQSDSDNIHRSVDSEVNGLEKMEAVDTDLEPEDVKMEAESSFETEKEEQSHNELEQEFAVSNSDEQGPVEAKSPEQMETEENEAEIGSSGKRLEEDEPDCEESKGMATGVDNARTEEGKQESNKPTDTIGDESGEIPKGLVDAGSEREMVGRVDFGGIQESVTQCEKENENLNQVTSGVHSLSESDRDIDGNIYENVDGRTPVHRSPEVSSTSTERREDNGGKNHVSVENSTDSDAHLSDINTATDQRDSSKFLDEESETVGENDTVNTVDSMQDENLHDKTKESSESNAFDEVSSDESSYGEDDDLDLTKTRKEDKESDISESVTKDNSDNEHDAENEMVTSSTSNINETVHEKVATDAEKQSGIQVENEKDEDKNSEVSLEEVSEEESDDEKDSDEKPAETKGDKGSLSGVEEVSSEEEEGEDEEAEKEVVGKEDLTDEQKEKENGAESGMEEVSEEEEESDDEGAEEDANDVMSEKPTDNISSDEEEVLEAVTEDGRNSEKKKSVKEVKQIEEKIDDTDKEDGTIVKEMLDKMTIKVEHDVTLEDNKAKKKERRKSKDKKEKRDTAKSKSKLSAVKDTRDINERLKAQASYGDDLELDYDDTVHDETKDKQGSESEGEITDDSSSSDGEIEDDCEEGEIREPGQKPYVKPTCRFFMRGHCTWGINCRFLHPGVNDKGNYQLIERPGFKTQAPPSFEEKWEEEEVERTPSPEPPPPAPEPKEETAWERGLRQAKELRKKAMERREMETNFEHKKMNLSIEDNPEFDKENAVEKVKEKSPVKKQPYYEKYEPLSDDEYYDQTPMRLRQKQMEQSWLPGHYENFEVYWTQEQYGPQQRGSYPVQQQRYPYQEQSVRGRERYPLRPSPRRLSPSPPMQRPRYNVRIPQRDPREMQRREKIRERPVSPVQKRPPPSSSPGRPKADEWNDPWRRSNVIKEKSPKKRSRSRGRRRSRRSYSYSSSYSSSSYSGSSRSRSRSSSFSSTSRSRSRSSSTSRSRSPTSRRVARRGMGRPHPPGNQPGRRPSAQAKPNEPPKSSATAQNRPVRVPDKRPAPVPSSPSKAVKGPAPPVRQLSNKSTGQQIADVGRAKKQQPKAAPPPQQPQRKFQMEVKARDRPLPQSVFAKEKPKSKQKTQKRTRSSSSSSRSRSRSSSSSRSSFSSRSSRSFSRSRSRSSSSSSSGSADSDHLYRNIGGRENQKPASAGRGKPDKLKQPQVGNRALPGKPGPKPTIGETSRPSSIAQAKVVKDPLKMTGQKSNIKLTLIKQNEKPPPAAPEQVSRKRPAEPVSDAPPLKRPSVPNPPKIEKPVKKPEKAVPVSPTKALARPQVPAKPVPAAASAAPAAPVVKKKSTVSRREELLKQLKAVEDAIAKKKKKMG